MYYNAMTPLPSYDGYSSLTKNSDKSQVLKVVIRKQLINNYF